MNQGSAFDEKHGLGNNMDQEKIWIRKKVWIRKKYGLGKKYGSAFKEKCGCKKIGTRDQLSMKIMGVKKYELGISFG